MKFQATPVSGLVAGLLGVMALCPSRAVADYASAVTALNPVAYYRFSNTNLVPAEVPAANLGTLGAAFDGQYQVMSNVRGRPGAIAGDADTSVLIDGSTGAQVVVPYSPDYNPAGPFSVEFWANPANNNAGNHTAASAMVNGQNAANANDRSGWLVRHNGTDWQFILGYNYSDNATYYGTTLTAPGTVTAGAWQHVVAVYDGSTVKLYVNGSQVASDTPQLPMLRNTGAPLILGDRGYTGWDYNGLLDEVAVYTTALSAADVQSHYANGINAARTTAYPDLVRQKGPQVYLRLGEASLDLPVAVNSGSYGAVNNGVFLVGTESALPGPQAPAVTGFESTNTAAGFNGTNGSVSVPALNLNTDTATMVCWIKRDGVQPARAAIMHNRKVTAPEVKATGLGFQDDGLGLSYNWEDQASAYNFNPGFVPPDQAWTFVAVAISPDGAVMFMGSAAGLQAATNNFANVMHDFSGTTLEIGWDNYQASRVFRGRVDEFAMFDKTLTYDQVAALYNAALPAILSLTRTGDPVYEGMNVTFQTTVAGANPVGYRWFNGSSPITDATNATLVLSNVTTANTGDYWVEATTGGKTLTSETNHLDVVTSPPVLTETPVPAVRFLNGAAGFSAAAIGSQPVTFQWKHGTNDIPGATSATLSVPDLQATDAGDYTVVVSNQYGSTNATATLTLLTPSKLAATVTDLGPVGYWRLNETNGATTYDYWGGFDGAALAGTTQGVAGPTPTAFQGFDAGNTAYSFNGSGGEVDVPALNMNTANATIVAWIKPNGVQADYAGVVFCRGGSTVAGLDYHASTGELGYHWNDAASTYGWDSGLYPTDGRWNFVALVVEPAQATIYLDDGLGGALQSSVNVVDHSPEEFNGTLRFGSDSGSGRYFNGAIDDVVIFNRSLTQAEIKAIHDAGVSGAYTPSAVQIVQQPKGAVIMAGDSYTLSAKAAGSLPLTFQWQKDNQDLPGAIRSSLAFASAAVTNSGTYQLFVTQGTTKVATTPVTLTVNPVPSYLNLSNSLVLHLKFDGDYKDSSGRNNNGTAQGSPQIVTGKIGTGALQYSTVVDNSSVAAANYVSLGTPTDLDFGPGDNFSLAFWIKFTGSPGDLPFLANNTSSMGAPGVTIAPSYNEGGWSWGLNDVVSPQPWPGVGLYDPVQNTLNDGTWHHLVHTFDRTGDGTTYLDGVKVNATSIANAATWDLRTGTDWNIGQAGGYYAEGGLFTMDDLGIWRRVLNDYEAEAIYVVGQNYGRSFDTTAPPAVTMQIQLTANGVVISWSSGTLESADNVAGPWSTVTGANPPSVTVSPAGGAKFYRVKL
jgi:hypothetical protein